MTYVVLRTAAGTVVKCCSNSIVGSTSSMVEQGCLDETSIFSMIYFWILYTRQSLYTP